MPTTPIVDVLHQLRLPAALLIAIAASASTASAQMAGLRTDRLADGVYAVVRTTRPQDPSDANSLVIINASDVVVVDGNITPRSTRAVIAEIRKLTDKPVRYVIVTHWHSDHHTGNVEYVRAWPEVEFVAHEQTRRDMLTEEIAPFRKLVSEEYPAEIRRMESLLATGATAAGAPLTDDERTRTRSGIAGMRYFIEEVATFDPIPPTLTFADSLVIRRGVREIIVRYLGDGNTRGDVVVHLPREGVLATGDLVVSPVPFGFGSRPFAWIATLDKLRQTPADVVLPGHGEPMRNWTYVDQLKGLLCAVTRRVVAAGGSSVPVDTLRARAPVDDLATRWAAGSEWMARAMRGTFLRPAVEGAHAELKANPGLGVPASCPAVTP